MRIYLFGLLALLSLSGQAQNNRFTISLEADIQKFQNSFDQPVPAISVCQKALLGRYFLVSTSIGEHFTLQTGIGRTYQRLSFVQEYTETNSSTYYAYTGNTTQVPVRLGFDQNISNSRFSVSGQIGVLLNFRDMSQNLFQASNMQTRIVQKENYSLFETSAKLNYQLNKNWQIFASIRNAVRAGNIFQSTGARETYDGKYNVVVNHSTSGSYISGGLGINYNFNCLRKAVKSEDVKF